MCHRQGHAIAGGCGLAIACDMRIMADYKKAKFGFNETQMVRTVYGYHGLYSL